MNRRHPAWKAIAAAATAAAAVLIPISTSQPAAATPVAASPVNSGPVASGTGCVKQIPVVKTMAVTPSGAIVAPKDDDGNARRYYYSSGDPTDNAWETVPPAGFSPLNASDATLAAYGFQPRPTNSAALAQWTKDMSGYRATGDKPSLCETDLRSGMATPTKHASTAVAPGTGMPHGVTNTYQSVVYAGGMAVNGTTNVNTLWTTDVKWTQPAFPTNNCGTPDAAYSVWGGIGGWNNITLTNPGKLLQGGVNTHANLVSLMFYEVIAPGHAFGAVSWNDTAGTVHGGDSVESWTYYDSTSHLASINVIDHTTGQQHSFTFSSWDGLNAIGYWDGTTTEAFTEDPSTQQTLGVPLLRPAANGTNIFYVTVNGQPIANFSSWKVNNWTDDVPTHKLQTTNWNGANSFINAYGQCT